MNNVFGWNQLQTPYIFFLKFSYTFLRLFFFDNTALGILIQ